ncbi:MAG: tail fiber domain-containing protein, partial [Parcubacteria group bacterium]|nr:tail fiber domain-containing protein [Parcubacteria group bacterium]
MYTTNSAGTQTERVHIDYLGNVGIGTTGPVALLDLEPASTYTGPLFRVASGSNERMRVTSSGNVGIGTTGPGIETTYATPTLTVHGGSSGGAIEIGSAPTDGTGTIIGELNYFTGTNSANHKRIAIIRGLTDGSTANQRGGAIAFFTKPDASTDEYNERLRITQDGNVGIGNTSPNSLLDVAGNITASTSGNIDLTLRSSSAVGNDGKFIIRSSGASDRLEIMNGSTPTSLVTIASTGNVGIGITAPTAKLHVVGPTGGIATQFTDNISSTLFMAFPTTAYTAVSGITKASQIYSDSYLALGAGVFDGGPGSLNSLVINPAGNVGIGSTAPAGKLDIVGDLTGSTNPLFRVASASELFRIQENGNVGINNISPRSKLEVSNGLNNTVGSASFTISRSSTPLADQRYGFRMDTATNLNIDYFDTSIWEQNFIFKPDGTFTASGSIGIGTTAPGAKLEVMDGTGGSVTTLQLRHSAGFNNGDENRLDFLTDESATVARARIANYWQSSGSLWGLKFYSGTSSGVNANPDMTIINGNVGIGTTGPTGVLHVAKDYNAEYAIGSPDTTWGTIKLQNTDAATNPATGIQFVAGSSGNSFGGIVHVKTASGDGRTSIVSSTDGGTTNVESLTVIHDGNVGIGTTGPDAKLDIVGGMASISASTANAATGDNEILKLKGTTAAAVGFITADGAGSKFAIRAANGEGLYFEVNDVDKVKIDLNGNLGIGTGNVDHKLEVVGQASISSNVYLTGLGAVTDNRSVCANATSGELEFVDGACGTSSARFKENIAPIGSSLESVLKLNPVYYNYLADSELASDSAISESGRTKRRIGF